MLSMAGADQKVVQLRQRQWSAEQVALAIITMVGAQEGQLLLSFNTFCHDTQAEFMGHGNNSRCDCHIVAIFRNIHYEGAVDF